MEVPILFLWAWGFFRLKALEGVLSHDPLGVHPGFAPSEVTIWICYQQVIAKQDRLYYLVIQCI